LVEFGGDVNAVVDDCTMLFYASKNMSKVELVQYLIDKGADISVNTEIILNRMAVQGHLSIIKYYYDNGYNIKMYPSILYAAFSIHHVNADLINYLLNNGADISDLADEEINDIICTINVEKIKLLDSFKFDLHKRNEMPLMHACRLGSLNIVEFLVDHGADIHVNNDLSIKIAYINYQSHILDYLCEHGCDINIDNSYLITLALTLNTNTTYVYTDLRNIIMKHNKIDINQDKICNINDAIEKNDNVEKYFNDNYDYYRKYNYEIKLI